MECDHHRGEAAAAGQLLGIVRTLRVRERAHLAAVLHDGPIQELAAATLELSLARRAAGAQAGDALDVPARQVEEAGRSLRRLMDELAETGPTGVTGPLGAGPAGPGLTATLNRRTAWLLASRLAVDLDEGAATLPAAEIEAVADLVELMLAGVVGPEAPSRAMAVVRAGQGVIEVELHISTVGDPAAAEAWLRRVSQATRTGLDVDLRDHRLRVRAAIPRRPLNYGNCMS